MTFSPCDPSTWPMVLDTHEVAAIYRRSVQGLRKACQRNAPKPFVPRPFQSHPFRWRRVEVLRDVEGARGAESLRRPA